MIETDFTEKLASKSYLTYNNPYARDSLITSTIKTSKRLWSKIAHNDTNAIIDSKYYQTGAIPETHPLLVSSMERPKGVPTRLRILAIDVPEFRGVFEGDDGECRVQLGISR